MKKIYIFTMGCPNRYLDSEKFKKFFLANDYEMTGTPEDADYILINTCAFRKFEEDRSLDKIKEFKKRKKESAEIIVCGCLPGINNQRMKEVFSGVSFVPKNIDKINEIFENKTRFSETEDANQFQMQESKRAGSLIKNFFKIEKKDLFKKIYRYLKARNEKKTLPEQKFYLRIGRGCMGNCTYCGIKSAIGDFTSKPLDVIMNEYKRGISLGHKKFVIVSDDSGAYGMDIESSLPELISQILSHTNKTIVELEEINARWLAQHQDKLIEILKTKRLTSLLVAVQSGSNNILKKMGRFYPGGIEEIIKVIRTIKTQVPNIKIKAQYIVGFPGETEDDAFKSLNSIVEAKIDEVNLFKFDKKPNTVAIDLPDQIDSKEIDRRIKQMTRKLKKHGVTVLTNN